MSLSNLTVKATYQGDGANDTFAIPFDPIIDDSAETLVYIRDEGEDPITETLVEEGALNEYTLTGAVLVTDFHTSVVFNAGSIPAADQKVIIIRQLPLTQTLALTNSAFNSSNVNKAFDRVVAMIQQLAEKLTRAPLLRVSEQEAQITLPEPVADTLLTWNSDGDDLENTSITVTDITDAQAAAEAAQAAAEEAQTAAEAAQTAAEGAQTAAETAEDNAAASAVAAALSAAEAAAAITDPWSLFATHSITDGQSATDLTDETVDNTVHSSAEYQFEIIRGTTVIANGEFTLQSANGTWRISLGAYRGDTHGVTFTVSQATTIAQLRAALDSGAGDGTLKLSRRRISV